MYEMNDKSFKLDSAIKNRALQGVEYIFANIHSSETVEVANEISTLITDNILATDSLAINLNNLKISDDYTFKHSVDVAVMSSMLARKIGLSEDKVLEIGTSGLLHDLGKVRISSDILNKPGKLTTEEFDIVKKHTIYGYELLKDNKNISEDIKLGLLQHHERYHGDGYPYGLKGHEIGIFGRILTIVDIYDALVTDRPYHKPIEPVVAYEMMLGMMTNFDPSLFIHFNNIIVLYNIGTIVRLSNGEECIVIGQNQGYPLRPIVRCIESGEVYDLANDPKCLTLVIDRQTGDTNNET